MSKHYSPAITIKSAAKPLGFVSSLVAGGKCERQEWDLNKLGTIDAGARIEI